MPSSPPKRCARCRLIHKGACDSSRVDNPKNLIKSRRWRRLRDQVIIEQGGICATVGCGELIQDVDHIVRRKDRPELVYSRSNLQGLCRPCHKEKTRLENGG